MLVTNKNLRFSGRSSLGSHESTQDLAKNISTEKEEPTNEQIVENFSPQKGQTVVGTVTRITDQRVYLDLRSKSEHSLPIEEFSIRGFGHLPEVGDKISVAVVGEKISFLMRAQRDGLETLMRYYESGKPVNGIILGAIRSGFIVWLFPNPNKELAVRAFLPPSQIDPQIASNPTLLEKYKKEEHPYYIARIENNLNVVVSRKSEVISQKAV